jgi:peptidoglycan/LPS O-acetylase OafA/YrhL
LIGGLIFNEMQRDGDLRVGRFLVRRMLRIWPAYYCLLAIAIARFAIESKGQLAHAFSRFWPALVNIQNYKVVPRPQLWSLAIEEHFYLALPLLLILLARRTPDGTTRLSRIPVICVALAISCLAVRTVLVLTTTLNVRFQTYLCIDALFFGVTLAYLRAYRPGILDRFAHRRGLLALGVLCLVPAVHSGDLRKTLGLSLLYVGYGLILIRLVYAGSRGPILNRVIALPPSRFIAWIGTYSYSIYLWHYDTGWYGYNWAHRLSARLDWPNSLSWLASTSGWLVMAVVPAVILSKLIEIPVMRLRERLFPPPVPFSLVAS